MSEEDMLSLLYTDDTTELKGTIAEEERVSKRGVVLSLCNTKHGKGVAGC